MKKPELVICALLIILGGRAQSYVPFPTGDAVWSVGITKYFLKGSVILNNLTYQRIFSTPKKIYSSADDTLTGAYTSFLGLIRNDSVNRKVYGIGSDIISEKLMYDFTKKVNDTIESYKMGGWWGMPLNKLVVQKVDSIMVMGKYRKRMLMVPVGSGSALYENWIEGIGSSFGPTNNGLSAAIVFDVVFDPLLCLHVNGQLRYQTPGYSTCYFRQVGLEERSGAKLNLETYPNPVSKNLTLEIEPSENHQFFDLVFYNAEGVPVNCINNTKLNHCEIDMSYFSKGIYLLRITNQSGYSDSRKIIKE